MDETKKLLPLVALRDVIVLPDVTLYLEIGREQSIRAVEEAMEGDKLIATVPQKDPNVQNPSADDLFEIGMVAKVKQIVRMPGQMMRVVITGKSRARLEYIAAEEDYCLASMDVVKEEKEEVYTLETIAMIRGLKDVYQVYANLEKRINRQIIEEIQHMTDLDKIVYEIMASMPVNYLLKQRIFEKEELYSRYEELMLLLNREIEILRIQEGIAQKVKTQVEENQKEYYLREEIKAIRKELGEEDTVNEADHYLEKLAKLKAPKKVKKKLKEEINRFRKLSSHSSENAVARGYIETLLKFPWKKETKETIDVSYAEKVLEEKHYGLKKVKERILESLAVKVLNPKGNSPILCLVGPPGTGKTSIARSVADALGRKYVRICLGGVGDEAEIRGHRRTYVGAMPGRIAAGVMNAGVKNPLILLDEIDKLRNDHKGDPASAMLEVLDPEQNKHFSDHYIELPIDLSKVLFLCTANTTDTIPRPLLDRMEIVELGGYTENEIFHIAKDYLLPRQKERSGLTKENLSVSDKVFINMIRHYTREAGVRNLEREISKICRKTAGQIVRKESQNVRVTDRNYEMYLGKPKYMTNLANEAAEIGVVRGLAWTSVGGDTLEIEVNKMEGSGKLELTGKLGEVMQESAKIAFTLAKAVTISEKTKEYFENHDFHLHVPEGATPKDGPSAGVTMATAFYSVIMEKEVRPDVAMTGEITLRGKVLAIGGLKEKLLAAKAAGIKLVFVPFENKKDISELEDEVVDGLEIQYAKRIEDIWKRVF